MPADKKRQGWWPQGDASAEQRPSRHVAFSQTGNSDIRRREMQYSYAGTVDPRQRYAVNYDALVLAWMKEHAPVEKRARVLVLAVVARLEERWIPKLIVGVN